MRTKELTGMTFGKLTVIAKHGKNKHGSIVWDCLCECGKHVFVDSHTLISGHSASCGCSRKESVKMINYKHGESRTRLYKCWQDMKSRCENKNNRFFYAYGARGICVCYDWNKDYMTFKSWALEHGYNDSLTLDRINVNGNYEPSNCKWSTQYEQANNRHNNHYVSYHESIDTLTNMCRKLNVNYVTIKGRMRIGYSFEDSVDKFQNTSKFIEYWKKNK